MFKYFLGFFGIGRVEHFAAAKFALEKHALHMRESFKSVLAVIAAHAGRANAAKGDVFLDNMPRGFVNTDAAGNGVFEDMVTFGFVFPKPI